MKINEIYSKKDLNESGLVERQVKDINAKVYLNGSKVFFFEQLDNQHSYRLYSIINKRSFFL
ncbi:MAG: hypothetical protein KJ578_07475 [Bacteroidetes bacterium]|jgi:hypothetical protein|nr:hypothetical protein [Bacteroidota bacterium]MBU1578830.1 hypothetical protein [Bacteroidota bacterium]MBU2557602.1 hypothetical protein [Bacteroidota bacterium]MDA3944340.1 hypothetical protein [Bacteroidota bacterium]